MWTTNIASQLTYDFAFLVTENENVSIFIISVRGIKWRVREKEQK